MKRIINGGTALITGVALAVLCSAYPAHAKIDLSKPLDTSKGLYIRNTGTRVYKDPLPRGAKVYTYRRKDGVIVRTYRRKDGTITRTYTRAPRKTSPRRVVKARR